MDIVFCGSTALDRAISCTEKEIRFGTQTGGICGVLAAQRHKVATGYRNTVGLGTKLEVAAFRFY